MEFFDALVRYGTGLGNHLDDRLKASGSPSVATVFALRVVERHGGTGRVRELRSELGITAGAASKLVDRLERDRLAERRSNPVDRRSSLVKLTAMGRQQLEQGAAVIERSLIEHVDEEADLATVTAVLVRLDDRLRAGAAAVAP
jgi:DNA-binding MarR family transcriptional regulator